MASPGPRLHPSLDRSDGEGEPPGSLSFAEAARFWGRLGLVSFGGPAGQIALLHQELVERRRWLSEARFLHALQFCLLLPGPEALQLATYLGWLLHGIPGGLLAGGLFLLPSVALLLALSSGYALWGQLPLLAGLFWALKPAVLAIVIQACWRLGRRTLQGPLPLLIAAGALVGVKGLGLSQPLVMALAALTGWGAERLRPGCLESRGAAEAAGGEAGAGVRGGSAPEAAVLHGDATDTPAHARPRPRLLALTLLAFGLALAVPLVLLTLLEGWNGTLATMARFFSRMALVSFGGAYAVLPYVAQGAVDRFDWLTAAQMVDGLALGETTPGPLINVVVFVGVLGGWRVAGSLPYALLAGLVVMWFTFLPSFLFILAGGPLVESSRGLAGLRGPLQAIAAAVVGMVASLALLFAPTVVWPQGAAGPPDLAALGLLGGSLWLLLGRGWGVLPLLAVAGLVGGLRLALSALAGGWPG